MEAIQNVKGYLQKQLNGCRSCEISWEEFLYYLFFGLLFAAKGIGLDEGQKLFTICVIAALFCLAVKLCVTKHSLKEWAVMLLLMALSCLTWKSSGEKSAFFAVLVIIGMKNVPIKRLLTVCMAIWSAAFWVSAVLGILHIRDGVVVVHQKLGLGPIVRWSWGYTHPNVLHVSYFILVALLLYVLDLNGKKLWKASALMFAGNLFVFLYSVSYTGILLVTGYLLLNVYLDCRSRLIMVEKVLLQCILPFCVLFPLLGPFVTSGKVFDFFNKLFSTRFELVRNFYSNFSPSLFGTPAYFETTGHLTLDSSFAYMLMYYGIIAFVLFMLGYAAVIHRFIRLGRKKELAIMLGIVVAGVTEQFLFNLSFKNLSFFFLGELLYELFKKKAKTQWWNQERALITLRKESVTMTNITDCYAVRLLKEKIKDKRIWLTALVIGMVAAVSCAVAVKMPSGIYVNRGLTDYRNLEEEVLLDLQQVSVDFSDWVIGYAGADVGMYYFTGSIIELEFIRNVAGFGMLGFTLAAILILLAAVLLPKRKLRITV